MTDIIMSGCNGRMGRVISELVSKDSEAQIVAGIDITGEQKDTYPVYKNTEELENVGIGSAVIIDFSSPLATKSLLDYAVKHGTPVVLCTTGLNDEQLAEVNKASEKVAILRSANMSLGVNVVMKLIQTAATVLTQSGFDIEVVEKHHNQKLDAPSGTALALVEAMKEVLTEEYDTVYDRSDRREKRPKHEIGVSAVRGGTIVGEHEVIFAGTDEVIEVKHTAYSRAIFGNGAIAAAKYLDGKSAGMYNMGDLIG